VIEQIRNSAATLGDFAVALKEFHKQRELDERGIPSASKLTSVGLLDLIREFDAK
jgi:hypothetical protein